MVICRLRRPRYHLLLVALYAPLGPLVFGAAVHARAILSRPPAASTLTYTSATSLTFDAVLDAALLLAVALHLALARFRPLPLLAPLQGASGLFPKQLAEGPAAHGEAHGEEALVAAGGKSWRRVYSWRTGETFYETKDGELFYPDGGPGAVLEESDVDTFSIGPGVSLGPHFKVVSDNSEAFAELWGHAFAATKMQLSSAHCANLLEAALECPDFWFLVGLYIVASFAAVAGCARAYHATTALGAVAMLLSFRHLSNAPQPKSN